MWLVRGFWSLCGMFTADLTSNRHQYMYSALLMATCVYNFIFASQTLCKLEHWCVVFSSAMVGMYTRVLASTTFLSRTIVIAQAKHSGRDLLRFKATIEAFETYSPTSAAERDKRGAFTLAVVTACLIIIVPVNATTLYFLYTREPDYDTSLLVYFVFIYAQNLSMCCVETQFVSQCYVVFNQFREINGDLERLRDDNVDRAKYPFMATRADGEEDAMSPKPVRYMPRFRSHATANAVETLRIKHWLARQAVHVLDGLFGMQMGLSVILLWVMAVFDIYYELYRDSPSKALIYGWLLQYSLRLTMIILMAHYTTKQAMKSKSLILETNNQMLDNGTKEELLLFVNQIRHHSIEFTAYDFFTLNTQVIKSAIAAGTTYLVILVQFHS